MKMDCDEGKPREVAREEGDSLKNRGSQIIIIIIISSVGFSQVKSRVAVQVTQVNSTRPELSANPRPSISMIMRPRIQWTSSGPPHDTNYDKASERASERQSGQRRQLHHKQDACDT